MDPRVSIIVPMYNVASYVAECLESLLEQGFSDFEAICVDDGSADGTLEVARAAVAGDERFIFLQQENSGQSAARNKAMDIARGEYLLNLDSDDLYAPDALGSLVTMADAEQLDILYFAAKTFYESRSLRHTNPERQDDRCDIPGVHTGQELYVEFERTGAFRPSACMFMMRRQLVEDAGIRFEEGIIHEDLLFTMMVAPLAQRCAFLNEPLYLRRMREGSTMTTQRGTRNIRGHLVAAMKMRVWLQRNAHSVSDGFCDAFCHRIYFTRELAMDDARQLGQAELEAFRDSLGREERIEFDLHCVEPAKTVERILGSTTYRAGRVLMAVPTALKDRLVDRG